MHSETNRVRADRFLAAFSIPGIDHKSCHFDLLFLGEGQKRQTRPATVVAIQIASIFDPGNSQMAGDLLRRKHNSLLLLLCQLHVVVSPCLIDLKTGLRSACCKGKYSAAGSCVQRHLYRMGRSRQYLEPDLTNPRLSLFFGKGHCRGRFTIQTDIPSIYKTLSAYFPVGSAVDLTDLSGPHAQLLTMHFDSITSGNEMKWSSVENTKGTYTFGNADSEVGLAVCNNMRIRGHNLVWATGAQTPSYAAGDGTDSPANQAAVTANIQEHIQSEVQHFGSKVYAWDVVNEPLDPSQPDCLAHGPFYQVLGKSYIDIALQAARQYAPAGTKLFINDYSTTDPNRLACLISVIGDLRSRGIPIDGIGHEMHNAINYPSVDAIIETIEKVHEAFPDIEQQITELDMSVYNAGDKTSNYGNNIPASVLAEQGWLYAKYFEAFRRLHGKIAAVTLWGMADDDTWLDSFPVSRTDYPLPFDMGLQAKPAYWGIVDPTQLPGYGLKFAISSKEGGANSQVWTLTATNGDVGPAYTTQITALKLHQIAGRPCSPAITAPGSYPIVLGDIATSSSASVEFTVNFAGCGRFAAFEVSVPWSSATYHTGTFRSIMEFRREHDRDDR